MTIKSRFGRDKVGISHERAYGHCISHEWVLKNVVRGRESNIGEAFRNFVDDKTLLAIFVVGVLICPITAMIVFIFYKSFAFMGASIAVFIVAVFLIRESSGVKASYGLLSWLRTQDESELREDDVVYAEVSLKTITKWRMILVILALSSLVAAPWGELLPEVVALATSGFLIMVFTLVYPPIAAYSHELGIIVTLYLIPLSLALLYFLFRSMTRLSASVLEKLQEIRPI
ncbi:MAG: hypothetical protein ACW987_17375 [Candidatus Thorarchaeota archaeon]